MLKPSKKSQELPRFTEEVEDLPFHKMTIKEAAAAAGRLLDEKRGSSKSSRAK